MNRQGVHDGWIASAPRWTVSRIATTGHVPNGQRQIANLPEIWDGYVRDVLVAAQLQNGARACGAAADRYLDHACGMRGRRGAELGGDPGGVSEALSVLRDGDR